MPDPRVAAYAELLVDRSIGVRPGWQVLVATTTEARPLAQELSRLLAARGAYALTRIHFGAAFPVDKDWLVAAPPELAATLPPLELDLLERVDASIFVLAPEPGGETLAEEPLRALRAQALAYRARGRRREIPSVRCDFPCPAYAERAGLPLAEFEDVLYAACLRDWDEEARRLKPIRARLARASEIQIAGEGTDLRLGLAGREWAIDDGRQNVPGGELFTSPVEESVEGEISFDFPAFTSGREVRGIRLAFRNGEVVEASAETGEELLLQALATDRGARRAGELGIGCNEGITHRLRNVLFDEKMAGTVHVALGDGFPHLGGRNASGIHWDLVKDLRAGGEIRCDGELVQRDGTWTIPA